MDADIIVVGAGLSGLSAAKFLSEQGLDVKVLEASDRVGGRTYTKKNDVVEYVDLGASYVGPTQHRIMALAEELGVQTYKVNEVEDLIHYKKGRRRRFKNGFLPKFANPFINMDVRRVFNLIDKMGNEIPPEAPWTCPHAEEWDIITFREFLQKNCWTRTAFELMLNFYQLTLACEPHESSLLAFLWYMRQCGGLHANLNTENGAQERKFVGGSQQLCEKMAKNLGEDAVVKEDPVIEIDQTSCDCVCVKTLHHKQYKTKRVIVAIPPAMQLKIHFSPPLPTERHQLIQRLPMGTVAKVLLYYETNFWRKHGISGTMFIEGGIEHPIFSTMDDSKPDGSRPAIIGFISTDKWLEFNRLDTESRISTIAKSLAVSTGCTEFLKPIHYEEKNWMEEQYIGGGYTCVYPPGFFTNSGKWLRKPVDRLLWAGSESAVSWSGYMEGAVEAGYRAAAHAVLLEKNTQSRL